MDREEILRRFEAWLDSVLGEEEPPPGVAAEILSLLETGTIDGADNPYDLYSMWSAMTALTQEVKLQGRSFKQLSETVAPVGELAPRLAEMEREAENRARREALDLLLDLRDRFGRGLETARAGLARLRELSRGGWRSKLLGHEKLMQPALETVAALQKGYVMSLDRLDEVLAQFDVREIPCQGQGFDPGSMQAVDLEETSQVPEGTVIEVYRAGYEWKGDIYRPAQVKVARRPGGLAREEQE